MDHVRLLLCVHCCIQTRCVCFGSTAVWTWRRPSSQRSRCRQKTRGKLSTFVFQHVIFLPCPLYSKCSRIRTRFLRLSLRPKHGHEHPQRAGRMIVPSNQVWWNSLFGEMPEDCPPPFEKGNVEQYAHVHRSTSDLENKGQAQPIESTNGELTRLKRRGSEHQNFFRRLYECVPKDMHHENGVVLRCSGRARKVEELGQVPCLGDVCVIMYCSYAKHIV